MPETADVIVPVRRLSPGKGHYFFGYYDIPAADSAGRHLCHQVGFRDRFPKPGDAAQLGWLPLPHDPQEPPSGRFEDFAETCAWNFQQGSMLQWLPALPDTCLYNIIEDGRFGACMHNIRTGVRRGLPRPVANVSRDGTKALCINMARLYEFRPGYGYEEVPDPFAAQNAPDDDGVFLMDLASGKTRLLLSLADAAEFLEHAGEKLAGLKVCINHITFNPSGSRYLFLLRNFTSNPDANAVTWLVTGDTAGGALRHHPVWGAASHYHWRDDDTMLFVAKNGPQGRPDLDLMTIRDSTGERQLIDPSFFIYDGHCSYSPDGRWILYDSYPNPSTPDMMRALQLYDLDRGKGVTLGRFRSEACTSKTVDLRCDLHPRWMPDGASISFDSIHEGFRGVYWADLKGV